MSASAASSGAVGELVLEVPWYVDVPPTEECVRMYVEGLHNSTKHLLRTNAELELALLESPGDSDFTQALDENKPLIDRNLQRLRALQALLDAYESAVKGGRSVTFVMQERGGTDSEVEGGGTAAVATRTNDVPTAAPASQRTAESATSPLPPVPHQNLGMDL